MRGDGTPRGTDSEGELKEAKPGTFIFEFDKEIPEDLCDELILKFESLPESMLIDSPVHGGRIDHAYKKATDFDMKVSPEWDKYMKVFSQSLTGIFQKIRLGHVDSFTATRVMATTFRMRRYSVDDYYNWHVDVGDKPTSMRMLAIIWYLNDVEEGGATEFRYQGVEVKPKRGKAVVFPPYWTHLHRGQRPTSEPKYMVRTFVEFG